MRCEFLNGDVEVTVIDSSSPPSATAAMHCREPFASPICSILHILWKRKE